MGERHQHRAGPMVVAAMVAAVACGRAPLPDVAWVDAPDAGGFDLSGYAVKGPISGGTVTAYKLLPELSRGELLASTTTDETGFFGLTLPAYNGNVLLVVRGGTYLEEALALPDGGQPPRLMVDVDFVGLVMDYRTGQPATANLTPISHLAYHLARYHVREHLEPAAQAVDDAFSHLGAHFGNVPRTATDLDWRTVTPASLTETPSAQLTAAQRAGLILVGFSQLALTMSARAGLSPGGQVNALSLVSALAEDLEADGKFDGLGSRGRLLLPSDGQVRSSGPSATALDGSTVRHHLAGAIADFVNSNASSGLTIPDTEGMLTALSTNSDPYLFDTPGTPFDVLPPRLKLVSPPPLETDQKTVSFVVSADDGPDSAGVKAVFARNGRGTVIAATAVGQGIWRFAKAPMASQPDFDVWAVDRANNSGELLPLGEYHLHVPCALYTEPPLPRPDRVVFPGSSGSSTPPSAALERPSSAGARPQ